MTPQQMQARSQEKVKQVMELMSLLSLTVSARERVDKDGFLEKIVFWTDDEKYTPAEPEVETASAEETPLPVDPAEPADVEKTDEEHAG